MNGVAMSSRAARLALLACLGALTVAAWAWLWPWNRMPAGYPDPSPAMAMPWTIPSAACMFAMWSVMMAAMMVPTALPMILAVERIAHGRRGTSSIVSAMAFAAGYLVVWTGFGALATLAQFALDQARFMSMTMASANRGFTAVVLLVAGAFQFTPYKYSCLRRCRSPMGFLLTEWQPGVAGIFATGVRHGLFCLGCCWALMSLLFVFGAMNLVAALGLTVLVLAEKTLPAGAWIGRLAGAAFVAWGVLLLLGL